MSPVIRKALAISITVLLAFFLVWPWINSAVSKAYHIKAVSEGSSSESYTANFDPEKISTKVTYYNNVATEEKATEETKTYESAIDDSIYKKLSSVANHYKGLHLVVRIHAGYSFFYESSSIGGILYTDDKKKELLEFTRILEKIARNDEKDPNKRGATYRESGLNQLNEFIRKYNIDTEE